MFYGQCTLCVVDNAAFIILKPFFALIISCVARQMFYTKNHAYISFSNSIKIDDKKKRNKRTLRLMKRYTYSLVFSSLLSPAVLSNQDKDSKGALNNLIGIKHIYVSNEARQRKIFAIVCLFLYPSSFSFSILFIVNLAVSVLRINQVIIHTLEIKLII